MRSPPKNSIGKYGPYITLNGPIPSTGWDALMRPRGRVSSWFEVCQGHIPEQTRLGERGTLIRVNLWC